MSATKAARLNSIGGLGRAGADPAGPFTAVPLAIDTDDRAVVYQPVRRCHCHGVGGEEILYIAEWLGRRHQQRPALAAVHHQQDGRSDPAG